jgi:DNA-binding GntR family transcriptional regulator
MKVLKQPVPLYQQAYEEIKGSILSGKFKPGSTITVSQLTEEFQISRTPLKEALRQLQNEGLLVLHPMGPKVIQFNKQDISELCYCRLVLEKEMIGFAVDHITDAELHEIEEVLRKAESCVKDGKNNEIFLEYNSRFHEILMNACPNKMLLQLLEVTRNKLLLYRAISIKDTNDQLKIISEHYEILKALQKRDKKKAIEAIEKHLLTDQSRYNLVIEE